FVSSRFHDPPALPSFPTRRSSDLFNCRAITGGTGWSRHAYGRAVDLNPRENPYLNGAVILPPDATTDRHARGAVTAAVVAAFARDRKSTRLNSSHDQISYAVFCLK